MIGRHIERPQIFLNGEAWTVSRHDKTGDPIWVAVLAAGAGKDRRFEILECPGDDCERSVLLIDGSGWCPAHRMTITVIERACA